MPVENEARVDPATVQAGEHLIPTVEAPSPESHLRKSIISSRTITPTRKAWLGCTWCITWCIPSLCLRKCGGMKREDVRMAWREKLALNAIIFLLCSLLLFCIVGIGLIVCPDRNVLSQGEIDGRNTMDAPYVSMYGSYYRIPQIVASHVTGNQWLNAKAMEDTTLGKDVSAMFFKIDTWDKYCPDLPKAQGWDNIRRVVPEKAMTTWVFHRDKGPNGQPKDYIGMLAKMRKGSIARDQGWIDGFLKDDPQGNRLLVAYGKVYDVSTYLEPSNKNNFLGSNIRKVIQNVGQSGRDATSYLEEVKRAEGVAQWKRYMRCMDGLLLTGVVDRRLNSACLFANYILLASTIIMVSVIGFKFLAALSFTGSKSPEKYDKHVIMVVPCYTEDTESLRKTIDSLAMTKYAERSKLLFVIADGMITGSGNDKPTPWLVLDVLGYTGDREAAEPRAYHALGEGISQLNFAQVYSGWYEIQGQTVPYLVVVKCGSELESAKPGNRGKRDSQLVLMNYLSRVHLEAEMCPLDLEMSIHIHNVLDLDPGAFEYALFVDADTDIAPDSLNRLVACMANDASVMGICGETSIKNEMASWVTAIQVYEYFISHAMAKAFESLFGTVTCLPGCFSMYRIKLPSKAQPILVAPQVVKDYSENTVDTLHKRNLLSLGEDRYLTTIMLKRFPTMKTCFTSDAKCNTIAPEKWSVFLSQRRRWINSTVHNLLELILLPDLCGVCIFSMRFVIFLDLFACLVSPTSLLYIGYLLVSTFTDDTATVPLVSLIMIAAIYGLQVIIFLLKREWQHLGWMIIYILAMPIYSFYLPLYSFWRWGKTRTITSQDGTQLITESTETFDPACIPMMTWAAFLDLWHPQGFDEHNRVMPDGLDDGDGGRNDEDESIWTGSRRSRPTSAPRAPETVLSTYRPSATDAPHPAPGGSTHPGYPSDEGLRAAIQDILAHADLAHTSKKDVFDQLRERFGIDFAPRSTYIHRCILVFLQSRHA